MRFQTTNANITNLLNNISKTIMEKSRVAHPVLSTRVMSPHRHCKTTNEAFKNGKHDCENTGNYRILQL